LRIAQQTATFGGITTFYLDGDQPKDVAGLIISTNVEVCLTLFTKDNDKSKFLFKLDFMKVLKSAEKQNVQQFRKSLLTRLSFGIHYVLPLKHCLDESVHFSKTDYDKFLKKKDYWTTLISKNVKQVTSHNVRLEYGECAFCAILLNEKVSHPPNGVGMRLLYT